jgi:hypothetical protein
MNRTTMIKKNAFYSVFFIILSTAIILTFEPPTPTLPRWGREHQQSSDYARFAVYPVHPVYPCKNIC